MSRTKISSMSKDLVEDDGTVMISIANGEQLQFPIQANWLTNLTGYVITSKIVEGTNDGEGSKPSGVKVGGVVTTVPIIDPTVSDNIFSIVIPKNFSTGYNPQPKPDRPVYGYIDLEIADTGTGNEQQIWKPIRGLVEILYSPSEA